MFLVSHSFCDTSLIKKKLTNVNKSTSCSCLPSILWYAISSFFHMKACLINTHVAAKAHAYICYCAQIMTRCKSNSYFYTTNNKTLRCESSTCVVCHINSFNGNKVGWQCGRRWTTQDDLHYADDTEMSDYVMCKQFFESTCKAYIQNYCWSGTCENLLFHFTYTFLHMGTMHKKEKLSILSEALYICSIPG